MATEEDWTSYARAVVDVVPPHRAPFRLVPDAPGATGTWPDGVAEPLVVVTAWNPDSIILSPGDNRARAQLLVEELDRLGTVHWPAFGRDPGSPHHEEGVAVPGMPEDEGIALGRRHGQAAIYVWTPESWTVVSCSGGQRLSSGWTVTEVPPTRTWTSRGRTTTGPRVGTPPEDR